jgi:DtxR family Mn-dependent transcriptional regulator
MQDIWKEFEHNQTTHSVAHHLMAIYDLLNEHGYARVTDVAKKLNITRGSASLTLKAIKEKGLVLEDENRFLLLSDRARQIVTRIKERNKIFYTFFTDVLGVEEEQAEIDACKIEHLISDEITEAIRDYMGKNGKP